ncbi:DUF4326 domain-containing protein [Parendozoicomonas haliclonae]|uniref:DUF4326 domain-containing protein n=1 Tax=Parendozoicomonas haliclonae TaxID=1960125 RepID=A0A1X7AL10_9GAMM|nr:DUF4326 domain-containing protein [Parendozoicomonas haliclonae]SMA48403.1 hypothetical protein EHSB41UT_02727 [Parendozoicomonas haliclonae]
MNDVLILYPAEFQCFSKFERKVLKILSNLQLFRISTLSDHNGFIARLCRESLTHVSYAQHEVVPYSEVTHAIIFDDGEEFTEAQVQLKEQGTPFRIIPIQITRVINIKREQEYQGLKSTPKYEYIGRGAKWGNPHSMFEGGDDREEVIRKYEYDFQYDKFPHLKKDDVYELAGKRLGCFCKPASCHGDVLAKYLNSWDDGK